MSHRGFVIFQLIYILGQSALYCAARNGKEAILELLFTKKGLNLNIQVASHGGTPLHGMVPIVRFYFLF